LLGSVSGAGKLTNGVSTAGTAAIDVTLTSTQGVIGELGTDTLADVMANRLTLRAAGGIVDLEVAVNSLDAVTTTGDLILSDLDTAQETTLGLNVIQAKTGQSSDAKSLSNLVSLSAQGTLRVGATNASTVVGDMIRLTSTGDSVVVNAPSSGDALSYRGGVAFVAQKNVQLYKFFQADAWMEYDAGGSFGFGSAGSVSDHLPSVLKSDTLILRTGGSLSVQGASASITAKDRLELVAGGDVYIDAPIYAANGAANGQIGNVLIQAKG